jgi:hypothetical protein
MYAKHEDFSVFSLFYLITDVKFHENPVIDSGGFAQTD